MYRCLQVKPIEEAFKFSHFFSPFLTESDFDAKPSILLLGQYSTGKVCAHIEVTPAPPPSCSPPQTNLPQPLTLQTTFIKSLLGRDYPGSHIGPEPTTDRFVVVYHGMDERRVPGNTLAVQKDLPYQV